MSPTGGKSKLTAPYVLRMTPKLKADLTALAKKDRRGLGEYIRVILEDFVDGKLKR
jgi:hypothetical protein